jgi:hypothetical protein
MTYDLEPLAREEIERAIRSRFADGAVASVTVVAMDTLDGEPVIQVRVEFNEKPETNRLRNLVRDVMPDISRLEAGFPIFSFGSRHALSGVPA